MKFNNSRRRLLKVLAISVAGLITAAQVGCGDNSSSSDRDRGRNNRNTDTQDRRGSERR